MGRSLIIDGIEIAVVRQFNAKSMRLKIDRKTASPVVTIPYFCPLFTVHGAEMVDDIAVSLLI